jgi:predicted metal-binding membrane protein
MALLFVGGVMNLLWIGGLALLVLVEKIMPTGRLVSRLVGGAIAAMGLIVLAKAASG